MMNYFLVGLGGFLGAVARYGLSGLVHRGLGAAFPYGTMVVNVLGCLVIGSVLYLVESRSTLGPNARLFVAIGILGGFTTFSSFGYETLELLRSREMLLASFNIVGNVFLGLFGVWLGWTVMKLTGM